MVARNRLPPWHEEVRLANGRNIVIRPIRPDDAPALRAGFELLQPEEVRQRFLDDVPEMTPELAHRMTHPDSRSEFALVVSEPLPPGEALIGGVARVAVVPGTRDAAFTVLVSSYVAGMGLGRHLMRRVVRWSRGKKLDRVHGDVREDNAPMLALLDSMGFSRAPGGTPGLVHAVLDLAPAGANGTSGPDVGAGPGEGEAAERG
ncbi:N-acetyltransferase [Luteimonas sp. MC1782]|nr:N-acetyltransferase [Luteimonas sp. MC1782]